MVVLVKSFFFLLFRSITVHSIQTPKWEKKKRKERERKKEKRGRFCFESWNSQWERRRERERVMVFTLSPLIRVPTELDLIPEERVWERYGKALILAVHGSVLFNLNRPLWDWCDSSHVPPYFSGPCQSTDYVLKCYVIFLKKIPHHRIIHTILLEKKNDPSYPTQEKRRSYGCYIYLLLFFEQVIF